MRVVVIGAGIGGLALARGLTERGHEVSVYESAEELRRGGAGPTLYPNGTAALLALGVDVSSLGRALETMVLRTPAGEVRGAVDLAALATKLGYDVRQLPRRSLLGTLVGGLPEETVRFGRACVAVRRSASGPVVVLDDGEQVCADVVVGADGVRSVVRRELWGVSDVRETGWASWLALTPVPITLADGGDGYIVQAPGRTTSAVPAGDGLVQWWFDLPWGPGLPFPESPVAEFRARFGGWADSDVQVVLEHARDEDVAPFPHVHGEVRHGWGRGAVTLLGDASHSFPPSTGQGANQALEDAWALTLALSGKNAENDPEAALRRYEYARYRRVARASAVSDAGNLQQPSKSRLPQGVRDRMLTGRFLCYVRSVSSVLAAERAGVRLP
ncbi:MAG TPA: FAD-dependent monooxygenase [Candidatus Nocardiopsis merdipullorum]|nr:FAD-dependent monooxygenase [Candidatus Nocardiopsis merdipullorum]